MALLTHPDVTKYKNIVGYGVGQYYENIKGSLPSRIRLTALYDRKWDDAEITEYDGLPVLRPQQWEAEGTLIILCLKSWWIFEEVSKWLTEREYDYISVDTLLDVKKTWSGKELKQQFPDGRYEDVRGNRIEFDSTLSDTLTITFQGNHNHLIVESGVVTGTVQMQFGNDGFCRIGRNTEIIGASLAIAYAGITVGENCLFSTGISVRTHDGHHIFDRTTSQRINYPRDIRIGNHVWIGARALLLGSFSIGEGSVVGAGSISSSSFGDHCVIAGSPARVIRENICWSREDTEFFSRDSLAECVSEG